ncbi:MAG: MBL fold metallo-hydrolase, partial [Deltaproteobacteria bacterium]|nr:MBL fold metallo-hydrolase [Deltaproteobacteria bacterium]
GTDAHHKTLGIMGFGRIGFAVAKRAAGFDMKILYHDSVKANSELEEKVGATFVDKHTLLAQADFVSLHVPLNPETHHFIGGPELAAMKRSAYLINTSRGEVVDEKALVRALKDIPVDPSCIGLIVITHAHWDHIGSAKEIKEVTAAPSAVHQAERDCVEEALKPLPPGVTRWAPRPPPQELPSCF